MRLPGLARGAAGARKRVLIALAGLAGALLVASLAGAGPKALAAVASFSPQSAYLGDSGSTYTVSVRNIGAAPIDAVRLAAPEGWQANDCPSGPHRWTTERNGAGCDYTGSDAATDGLPPGSAAQFTIVLEPSQGDQDATGSLRVVISGTSDLAGADVTAAAVSPGLNLHAYAWQVLDVVLARSAPDAGAPCPDVQRAAHAGSGVIVVCGRNRGDGTQSLSSSSSTIGGSLLASSGTFSGGDLAPSAASARGVVLGSWAGATFGDAGSGKDVQVTVGSGSGSTSPSTSFGGFSVAPADSAGGQPGAANHAPHAVDDTFTVDAAPVATLPASGPGSPAANDTDADGDSLVVTAVSDSTSGSVSLADGRIRFRFDSKADLCGSSGGFQYTVSDGQGGTASAHVKLVVSCGTPRPHTIALTPSSIAENEPAGTRVGTLSMTTGSNEGVTYALVSGNGSADNASFTIDGATVESAAPFDYEAKAAYSIRVRASVPGAPTSIERALKIAVTDANDAPTDIALSSTHVSEGEPSGTSVGDFSATDQDAGQTHTYALVSGAGSSDNGSFTIDGATLKTADVFSYASKSSYSIRVQVADSASATFEKEFTISVDRVNHAPTPADDSFTGVDGQELDVSTASLLLNDSDPDGDSLAVTDVSNAVGGTVSLANGNVAFTGDTCGDGAGGFDYTVSDGFGGSAQAHVTVNLRCAPAVTTDPSNTTVNAGDTASFTSAASGNPAPTVQWQVSTNGGGDWNDIGGATSSTLSFTAADGDDGNQYRAVFTNAVDTSTSAAAALTVQLPPSVTLSPTDQSVHPGETVTFTAAASGRPTPTVQWQSAPSGGGDWADIDGATTTTLSFTALAGDGGNVYRAVFTNAAGTDTTSQATLFVNSPPSADDQSVSTNEDTLKTITLGGGDADGNGLSFAIVAGPSHGALGSIGTPNCTGTPSVCTAGVDYTPSADYNGSDSFTFKTNDGSDDSSTATVTITVGAVNDAPSFTKGADQVVAENAGAQTVTAWATSISPGPADESSQTVQFNVTNDSNDALFSVVPAVSAAGGLTYTPATDATGSATITLDVQDDGGTANGGVDTSAAQTFTITVDAPPSVSSTSPANGATGVATNTPITVQFSESVNASTSSFTLECPTATNESLILVTTAPASSYTIDPASNLPTNTTCTLTVLAAQVTDANGFHPTGDASISFQTVSAPPAATDDSYTATGNVGLTMPVANGVTQNDTLSGGTLHGFGATSGTADSTAPNGSNTVTTSNGGSVTLASDGSFTYDPPPGYTGADGFYYDLHNAGGDSVGHATITVSNMIWFVDNTAGAGDGRLDHPFNSLGSLASINTGAAPHPQNGDTIFVYTGSGAYTGGITLRNSQLLIGQGASASIVRLSSITLAPHSNALPATGGTAPTFTAASGNDVTLGSDNTIRGVTLSDRSGCAIFGSSFGTLTVQGDDSITGSGQALNLSNGSLNVIFASITASGGTNGISLVGDTGSFFNYGGTLSGSTGDEFVVSGGSANVAQETAAAITKTGSGRALTVSNVTGGTVTMGGPITDTDGFGSGVSLTNNTGATISFSGGLVLSTGSNAAFTATGGGTVNVNNSSATNTLTTSTATALNVQSTTIGATGLKFQSITSSGGTCGINLSSTGSTGGLTVTGTGAANSGGTIQSASTAGVCLSSTSSVSLSYMQIKNNTEGIKGTAVSGFALASSTVSGNGSAAGKDGLDFAGGLTGTASITSSTITTSADNNVVITNSSGTLNLTVTGSTFSSTTNTTSTTNNGLEVDSNGTANSTVSVTGSTFTNNHGYHFYFDTGTTSSGTNSVTFSNNTLTNTLAYTAPYPYGSVYWLLQGTSTTAITANSNNSQGADHGAFYISQTGSSSASTSNVKFTNNTVGSPSVANSGAYQTSDILVRIQGLGTMNMLATGNNLYQYGAAGLDVAANDTATVNLTASGNTVSHAGSEASWGIVLGVGGQQGANPTFCAAFGTNSITGSAGTDPNFALEDIELDWYAGTYKLPSYSGSAGDTSGEVETYLQNRIGGSPTAYVFDDGVTPNFVNTSSCPTPP